MRNRRAKVYREYSIGKFGRLDILIEIPNQLLMIIECKMLSSEGDEQTNRYTQWINEERKDNIPLLNCFLTPDGSDPESKAFLPFSYKDVYELFNAKFIQENLTDEKIYLVNNFKKWIKEFMGQDKSITELCRKLYSKYKLEFDLIYSSMPTLKSFYAELAESINKQFSNNYFAHFGSYWMTISPKSWLLHEELREGSKYTLPRFQITSFGEKQYFTLVGPPTGDLNNFISEKSESYFKQNILLKSYKDWGKIYYPFEIVEPFDPESIINNWDQIISEYTIKSIELMKKIEFFLPEQELLNFKK
jgi:hypothetical protein